MSFTKEEREILRALYDQVRTKGAYPTVEEFKARFGEETLIDLGERGFLCTHEGRVQLRLRGLRAVDTDEAAAGLAQIARIWETLRKDLEGQHPLVMLVMTMDKGATGFGVSEQDAARLLTFIEERCYVASSKFSSHTGLVEEFRCLRAELDDPVPEFSPEKIEREKDVEAFYPCITMLSVDGYRALDGMSAAFGSLIAMIGANAAGKSSLFDLLRFLSFAAVSPLPPEIDPGSVGRTLFHVGGPERIRVDLKVDLRRNLPVNYHLQIAGPIASPALVKEVLARGAKEPGDPSAMFFGSSLPVTTRVVSRPLERHGHMQSWTLPANELTLRRALDPTLVTASAFQRYLSSFRFYDGFDTGPRSPIRRPVMSEPAPILAADGSNLSAVLFWLMTEHRDAWEELELRLRTAVPGFQALGVKPRGGPGTVLGVWREDGVPGELTLADLSDGTLLLLCWAALCLSPTPPPLVCIDEPEIGLHPRVLPVLASLLRTLSTRTQVLVATHSPYLVSQFDIEQIAVMKKENGKAVFRRPADQEALRREIEELGGEEIARMHISDELEARS